MANVNSMQFVQAATLLGEIVSQMDGRAAHAPVDLAEFTTVAQHALKTGYDPLMTAISQVLAKTIFSVRPYSARFKGMMVDSQKWGAVTRKLNIIDSDFEEDDRFKLVNGESIDQQQVKKPEAFETRFYGAEQIQKHITIYRDQLDVAFSSPAEFNSFISMVMTNVSDQFEQANEAFARQTLCNMIGGAYSYNKKGMVVHLLTEYNDYAGTNFDADDVRQPANFPGFAKWMYARINTVSQFLTERTTMYHMPVQTTTTPGEDGEPDTVVEKHVHRHTPVADQKFYVNTGVFNQIATNVLSGVFNADKMKLIDYEEVNFWQSIDAPTAVSVKPSVYDPESGAVTRMQSAVEISDVVAVLFDREACGITTMNEWNSTAPFNARGGYQNTYYHRTLRSWNDFTENCVVFVLD